MRHATDPDHVVAVSTIVSREKSIPRAGWIGVLWGVGHTITILVVGAAIILFGFVIPPRLGLALEFSVALMLILLGVLNLSGAMKWISHKLSPTHPDVPPSQIGAHSHLHFHDGTIHVHPHSHVGDVQHHEKEIDPPHWLAGSFVKLGWFHSLRPLLIGIVHGLAGSAAVALLVLGTIHEARWAIFYLLLFGIGTIIGMMLMTLAFAVPVTVAGKRFAWISRTMVTGTGVLSLLFGLVVAYQIGVVNGLFSSHPSWTPH
jgi:high-affinity nickel-transport protein